MSSFDWKVCALSIPAVVILLGLGTWQLQRAEHKRVILAQFEDTQHAAEVALEANLTADFSALRNQRVSVRGSYDAQHQFLLDNQVEGGLVGYHVLTPLRVGETGQGVLVDRGWVAQGQTRQSLPVVAVDEMPRQVRGRIYVPFGDGLRIGPVDEAVPGWPRVVQYLDLTAMAERLGYGLLPLVIRLDPAEGDGYRRQWKLLGVGPERHVGYALQWYGLALALIVIVWVLARRHKVERNDDRHEF